MIDKVTLLCVASERGGDGAYRLFDEELGKIEDELQRGPYRDLVEFIPRSLGTVSHLANHLLRHRPDILHLSGHGEASGGIAFSDTDGSLVLVRESEFAAFLKSCKDNIRLVFLNVCYSKACVEAIAQEIDFAIGLDGRIEEQAAIDFAAAFYQAFAFGRSVKEAYEMAKAQVNIARSEKPLAPVLLVRPGVDDWAPFVSQRD